MDRPANNSRASADTTSRFYTIFDETNPPPHPGPAWTRFVCISDTHSRTYQVPDGDVLLHAGDLSSWGHPKQLQKTLTWLQDLPHPVKIITAGNHDLCLDHEWAEGGEMSTIAGDGLPANQISATRSRIQSAELKESGIYYLEHESMTLTTSSGRTWEVYASPSTPRYALGAFQYQDDASARSIYANIPSSTEILITHTPPHRVCDLTRKGKHAGCKVLAEKLRGGGLQNCRLHIFGHIHEARGAVRTQAGGGTGASERISVNAAMPDSEQAIIVDLLN